jgi:molybdopterin/thiamine biosynthesis adenylyltransferase
MDGLGRLVQARASVATDALIPVPCMLTDSQIERYSRHIVLPEVGGRGQETLLRSSIALLGEGQSVVTAALYLVAAGVGKLALPEEHTVYLRGLNADAHLSTLEGRTIDDLVDMVDIVICSTAPCAVAETANASCVARGTPLVWATAQDEVGYLALFESVSAGAPCLACLGELPAVPRTGAAAATLLGTPVAAMVGSLLAGEAIKVLLHVGERRTGRLWVFSAHDASVRDVAIERNPTCRVCATRAGAPRRGGASPLPDRSR